MRTIVGFVGSFITSIQPRSYQQYTTCGIGRCIVTMTGHTKILVWFRNDLRIHDNPALTLAASIASKEGTSEVLPLYCFDPTHFGKTRWGNAKTGLYRAKFLLESVADLREHLRNLNSELYVRAGDPASIIPQLLGQQKEGDNHIVIFQREMTSEETEVENAVEASLGNGVKVEKVFGATLYDPEDLRAPISKLPDVYTKWRTDTEAAPAVRIRPPAPSIEPGSLPLTSYSIESGDLPTLEALGFEDVPVSDKASMVFKGGETAGLARLNYYLFESDCLQNYFETRNGMLGADYSSKFSPWLALGCLSARKIKAECDRYEVERVKNKSTYWMTFELMWRDYFRFYFMKYGNRPFFQHGVKPRSGVQWKKNPAALSAWTDGRTGVPLVDANMRELSSTGFMSNRGRQNVASYLVHDLGLDWREGGDWFESLLIDMDVCSNWGNWHAIAGLSGGRLNRFNMVKQSKDYDADGRYLRHWLPELKDVPNAYIHQPHLMPAEVQEQSNCIIGQQYPSPLPTLPFQSENYGNDKGGRGGGARGGGGSQRDNGGGQGRGRLSDRANNGKRRTRFS